MKWNVKKPASMLVVLSMLMLTLSACGGAGDKGTASDSGASGGTSTAGSSEKKDEGSVKLKFYAQYSGPEKAVYDAAAAEMKKVMPEVSVDFEVSAQDDEQKIKTYAAAGTLPDIFYASSGLIETLKKSDNLAMMDDVIKENKLEEKLTESAKPMMWNKDGHSYAVPNVGQWAALIFYNKDLFTQNNVKVPTNYDEFLAAVKAFNAKKITPLAVFAKEKWPAVQLLDLAVVGSEPGGLKKLDNGEGTFSDEAYAKGAQKLEELTKAGLISKNAFNTTADDASAQFSSGKAAMYMNGAWSMSNLDSLMGDKVGILYTPLSDADKVDQVKWNLSGGGFNQGFAVSKNSKNKDVAVKYAALFSLEFAKQRVILLSDPNSILAEKVTPQKGLSSIQQQYADDSVNFKTMTTFAWGYENAKFKTAMEDNTQKLLAGQSAADFIKDMNKALETARK